VTAAGVSFACLREHRRRHQMIVGIVAATVAAMVIGGIYYAPPLFGMRMTELTKAAYIQRSPMQAMIWQVGFTVVTAIALALLFRAFGVSDAGRGAMVGFHVWVIVAMADAGQTNFSGRPWSLWLINAVNFLITFLAMGAILGALHVGTM